MKQRMVGGAMSNEHQIQLRHARCSDDGAWEGGGRRRSCIGGHNRKGLGERATGGADLDGGELGFGHCVGSYLLAT